jgi:hypothetical protein
LLGDLAQSPLVETRKETPETDPLGIFISMSSSFATVPWPKQDLHIDLITLQK